ncbi:MAG: 3'-5' exonuclease [Spirochaetota bacterium]|nr:MAG: 3'-5' exonuclease [Spirochaetota bacterium]
MKSQNKGEIVIVIDLETTGLYPESGDMIIEIAAIPIINNEIHLEKSYETLVNPGKCIPPNITRINHITNDMVKTAPPIEQELPKFLEYIEDSPLVAHNAPFDIGFLQYTLKRLGYRSLRNPIIDTVSLSKKVFKKSMYHNMDAVLKRLSIQYDRTIRHRAKEDAYLTALAYLRLSTMI